MKKLKQIIAQVKAANENLLPDIGLLWQLICYSPKMPLRLSQQTLSNESEKFTLQAYDDFFTKGNLTFNGFKWGTGSKTIFITHGWGSKAADFSELIAALLELPDTTVIAYDMPGNGSSEGELSNGELFARAALAVVAAYGPPAVMIGHSLGGMANIMALLRMTKLPQLVISITPLIRLKENFEATMTAAGVPVDTQTAFLDSFKEVVGVSAGNYDLEKLYRFGPELNHLVLYDEQDGLSPFPFIRSFLSANPQISSRNFVAAGHERIIKSPDVILNIVNAIKGL